MNPPPSDSQQQPTDDADQTTHTEPATGDAPHPGSHDMPQWDMGTLAEPPRFGLKQLPLLLGPGLVMGAAAIGGGEWLTGPINTARYGGAVLWLATLSILGQTLYNIEISRYTLYTGEPIFTGKFRTLPGPRFWLPIYLVLDMGVFFPYLAASAAIPLFVAIYGRLPDAEAIPKDAVLLKVYACAIFLAALLPLLFGGKVYNSLKVVMSFKLIAVLGFLIFLAVFYSNADTWVEIFSGFFKFGTMPVVDNNNPAALDNIITSLFSGRGFPEIDMSVVGILAAMAAIAGNGGLTNTPISNYTRDQGWGMGSEVGAIPSIIGGQTIHLSHVGKVFQLTTDSLRRWKGWVRHISRDQLIVWMPACFIGIALPSMLSVQFLERGLVLKDKNLAAVMTAQGVQEAVEKSSGATLGDVCYYMTILCGFLVLGTSVVATADGALRRWVDVFWTASKRLRQVDPGRISKVYFGVLCAYCVSGITLLLLFEPIALLKISTNIYNYALGFSCWHTVAVNTTLLPAELKPSLRRRATLIAAGAFFVFIAIMSSIALAKDDDIIEFFQGIKGFFG